ncbi:MAG: hypothetical protein GWN14_15155, partial [candidate division Zixibacteria bacterium]|nr:hypothetical protein [Gammaproteobacteria bacterium]NIX57220.1 hypothetical protein [candidate division Zixibacteria bacterium]
TCRLCHVDLGFGMQPNSTGITEDDNLDGLYCGACHNGEEAFGPKEFDEAGNEKKNCERCHSKGLKVKFETRFRSFFKGFPRSRFGNKVDWLKA